MKQILILTNVTRQTAMAYGMDYCSVTYTNYNGSIRIIQEISHKQLKELPLEAELETIINLLFN